MRCSPNSSHKSLVAVSILPQEDFARKVIGQQPFDITVLIPPGASPENYELGPEQMQMLSQAGAYFKLGSGMPFENVWLGKIEKLNPQMLIVDCSQGIEIITGTTESHGGEGPHGEDPHIWLSPKNAMIMVENIANGMAQIDPVHENDYLKNAAAYIDSLKLLDAKIKEMFASITNGNFIVFHPAWGYFARDYGLNQIPIEIEGKEPKAEDLQNLVQLARKENIRTVFASPEFNAESAKVIAREINGQVVYIDPLAKDYIANLLVVTDKFAEAMKQ